MEFLSHITPVDVLVVFLLAIGALAGWIQGFMRYVLCSIAVLVAFIVAALLKESTTEVLGFWTAFTPRTRETIVFLVLFVLFVAGLWVLIHALRESLQLRVPRIADEIGGAVVGMVFVSMCIVFFILVLDTLYLLPPEPGVANVQSGDAELLRIVHGALSDSGLAGFLLDAIAPTVGLLARPFVPDDVRAVL